MIPSLPLPDWVPWWANLAVLIAGLLFALMFLLMPFAVFGVKGRLEALEARLDEIQGEIRSLSLRLPEPGIGDDGGSSSRRRHDRAVGRDEADDPDGYAGPGSYVSPRPPIPPAPRDRKPPVMPPRTEPRLY